MPRKRTARRGRVASKRRSVRVGGSRRKSRARRVSRRRVLRGGYVKLADEISASSNEDSSASGLARKQKRDDVMNKIDNCTDLMRSGKGCDTEDLLKINMEVDSLREAGLKTMEGNIIPKCCNKLHDKTLIHDEHAKPARIDMLSKAPVKSEPQPVSLSKQRRPHSFVDVKDLANLTTDDKGVVTQKYSPGDTRDTRDTRDTHDDFTLESIGSPYNPPEQSGELSLITDMQPDSPASTTDSADDPKPP